MKKFFFHKDLVTIPTFMYDVRIVFTNDFKKAGARLKMPMSEKSLQCYAIAKHAVNVGESTIFFPLDAGPGTIAHECWHVVNKMLATVGAQLENEVVAYHLGYLVRHCHCIQHKAKKRKRK